jgi:hypothetical protein
MERVLDADERALLLEGLRQWGGPATPTDGLAVAMGFRDAADFYEVKERIIRALEAGEQLSGLDARRALVATEIIFASDVLGAGVEWSTVTGWGDETTLRVLRQLQRKIVGG